MISHRLKWGLLHPIQVGMIAQHVKNGERRKIHKTLEELLKPCTRSIPIYGIIKTKPKPD